MSAPMQHLSQPLASPALASGPLAGWWHLAPRRTVSLQPQVCSVLRIAQGRVWVTMAGRQGLAGQPDSGDVVLHAGDELAVPAGAHLVLESWPVTPDDVVRFDLSVPAAALAAAPLSFEREVASAAHDLGQALLAATAALGRAGWALGRMLRGLAGMTGGSVQLAAFGLLRILSTPKFFFCAGGIGRGHDHVRVLEHR